MRGPDRTVRSDGIRRRRRGGRKGASELVNAAELCSVLYAASIIIHAGDDEEVGCERQKGVRLLAMGVPVQPGG
jgi:hypothetical protein